MISGVQKKGIEMYYCGVLDSLVKELSLQIEEMEQELLKLPEGRLSQAKRPSGTCYYQLLPPRGFRKNVKRIGITKNPEMIHLLARKRYIKESLSLARKNLQTLQKARDGYMPFDPAMLRTALGGPYSHLPPEMFTRVIAPPPPDAYDQRKNPYRKTELIHMSPDGVPMRTKSEVVIAGRLGHFNVPSEYEKPIELNGITFHPDFTIERPRDGKTIYWEHAGMMEDPGYRRKHDRKMSVYEEYGIVPWSNLIVTYDDANGGIDLKLVDGLIRGWLL